MLCVRAPNRGLRDLYACYLMVEKEGWPGMVVDHVIIPGTKFLQKIFFVCAIIGGVTIFPRSPRTTQNEINF